VLFVRRKFGPGPAIEQREIDCERTDFGCDSCFYTLR